MGGHLHNNIYIFLIFNCLLHAFAQHAAKCSGAHSTACISFHRPINCCSNYNITTEKKKERVKTPAKAAARGRGGDGAKWFLHIKI